MFLSTQTLLMAHALQRVSLSIARPSDAQFAFVAHNPGSPDTQLYCHLFKARHARAVCVDTTRSPSPCVLPRVINQSYSLSVCVFKAQFLNLLLCRCFQLYYLEKHPEESEDQSSGKKPARCPSLLNHGFPLSVNALVSFRRAPTQDLLPATKAGVKKKICFNFFNLRPQNAFLQFSTIFKWWFLFTWFLLFVIRSPPNPAQSRLAVRKMSSLCPLLSYVSRPWGTKCCAQELTVPSPALLLNSDTYRNAWTLHKVGRVFREHCQKWKSSLGNADV